MDVWQMIFAFPVIMTAVPFFILFILLLLSVLTGFFGEIFPDMDAEAEVPGLKLLLPIGITRVPLMISLPVIFFFATAMLLAFSFIVSPLLTGVLFYSAGTVAIFPSCYISLYLASWVLRPLAPLFDSNRIYARVNYIGMTGRVRTGSVNESFGEVVVTRDGIENQIDVYCDASEELRYGDEVRILNFNDATRRYFITRQ
ncbi:hypothetical protein [Oceanimonas baumannii]|uniref:hypothetical protein n=1 Tax=Oceanimonas baumannii TaxID=129578 RepID=UPI003A8E27A6